MLGITDFWLFVVSGLMLNVLPGPDNLYIVGRSASQGFKAGSAASLGIGTGTVFHILAAAFGLSALLATSALAFTIVKFIGAAYLIYMAVTLLLSKASNESFTQVSLPRTPLKTVFWQGFLTNFLNPKIALFFMAFVPQFISPESEHKVLAFLVLGLVFNINGMIWCHFMAWSASFTSGRIKKNEKLVMLLKRGTGVLFGYFAVRLAMSESA